MTIEQLSAQELASQVSGSSSVVLQELEWFLKEHGANILQGVALPPEAVLRLTKLFAFARQAHNLSIELSKKLHAG